jgi:hypothetical protein
LEILITQHLRRVVPRPEVLLFARKSFISERDLRDMFKEVQRGLQERQHINHCGIS